MNTQQDGQKMSTLHWAIELRNELFINGSSCYNEFIRDITADLEGLIPRMVTPKELDAVKSTLIRLRNNIAQLEGKKGNHLERDFFRSAMTNDELVSKKSTTLSPFRAVLATAYKKAEEKRIDELDRIKDAGDFLLKLSYTHCNTEDSDKLANILVEIFTQTHKA